MFQPNQTIPRDKLKDIIQQQIATKRQLPLSIVEEVLSFSFSEAKKAFKSNTEVEISGFGKFKVIPKRVDIKINKAEAKIIALNRMLDRETNPQKIHTIQLKLNRANEDYAYLKSVKDELTKDL